MNTRRTRSFRTSVALLISEWFVIFFSSVSCVGSYSLFFFFYWAFYLSFPNSWTCQQYRLQACKPECNLTDPSDTYGGMHFILLPCFGNAFYKKCNFGKKKIINLTLVILGKKYNFFKAETESDILFLNS